MLPPPDRVPAPPYTPEATVGPFYPVIFVERMPRDLTAVAPVHSHRPAGQNILVTFRVLDANGDGVRSVIIETWQANAGGRYRHPRDSSAIALDPHFDGFARVRTGSDGTATLRTIMPGSHRVLGQASQVRAPHLRLTLFASGVDRLVTQMFFDGDEANGVDPILASLPAAERSRLLAVREPAADADDAIGYIMTIRLRGERETPFFDDWAELETNP